MLGEGILHSGEGDQPVRWDRCPWVTSVNGAPLMICSRCVDYEHNRGVLTVPNDYAHCVRDVPVSGTGILCNFCPNIDGSGEDLDPATSKETFRITLILTSFVAFQYVIRLVVTRFFLYTFWVDEDDGNKL